MAKKSKTKAPKKAKAKKTEANKLAPFDKYHYYLKSVQSPKDDVEFYEKAYHHFNAGKIPVSLREDFCAAFANSCAWVEMDDVKHAFALDIDPEPLDYGRDNYMAKLTADEQERMHVKEMDVLADDAPEADIIAATNFSYFFFKKRQELLHYLTQCHKKLNKGGVMIMDIFGGSDCYEANEHETEYDDYSYFWDQNELNPITNEVTFAIHFKRKGEKKRVNVFTYDWRFWSIAEVRDILEEAGFSQSVVYWEGTDEDGEGNGEFEISTSGEECESWIAYIVGKK